MIKRLLTWGFTVSISLYVLTHYITVLKEDDLFLKLLSVFGLLALCFSLLLLRKKAILPLFLVLFAGIISAFDTSLNFYEVLWEGLKVLRTLISMLFVIPVIGWVLKQENYIEDTIILLKKWLKNSKTFYFVHMFLTQIISFFLLFGSIAVVYQMLHTFFPNKTSLHLKRFKATAVLRGFALSMVWVISIPSLAFSIEVMDASLFITFVQGFCMALAGLFLAVIYMKISERRNSYSFSGDIDDVISTVLVKRDNYGKLSHNFFEFFFLFFSLLITTFLANIFIPVSLLIIIPLVIVTWTVAFFLLKRKMPVFLGEIKQYVLAGIPSRAQEFGLLLSVGLLITALNASGLSENVTQGVYHLTENTIGLNFLWVLPMIVLSFGFVGMGPIPVMVLIAGIIKSIQLPYPPELIVLAMTLGSTLSILLSPLVIPVILLSGLNGMSPLANSFRENWKFAIGFYLLVQFYIQLSIL